MIHKLSNHIMHATTCNSSSITHATAAMSRMQLQYHACNSSNITISRMQQQQCHACNSSNVTHATAIHACNSSVTHATAAISRMQQQQCHACNSSSVTHATAAMSRMQRQFTHASTICTHPQYQQCHACNSSNVTHAIAVISRMQQHIHTCNSGNHICMQQQQCTYNVTRAVCAYE